MNDPARVATLPEEPREEKTDRLRLESGRQVVVRPGQGGEVIEVREADGGLSVSIQLTPEGPVLLVQGARLSIQATQSLTLAAPTVDIQTAEALRIRSDGAMDIQAREPIRVHSDDDVVVTGKIIHLN
jgi:hypothetical protein